MKKFVLLMLLCSVTVANVMAQGVRKKLLVDYFSQTSFHYNMYTDIVRNGVIDGIQGTGRLAIVDVNAEVALQIEASRRSDESLVQDSRLVEMRKLGADYFLIGTISNISTEAKHSDNGKTTWRATVIANLKVVNVPDATIYATETYTLTTSGTSEEKALSSAAVSIENKMKSFVNVYFPLYGNIIEVKETKKEKLVSCYIDLGFSHGVSSSQAIKVSVIRTIVGRRAEVEIGRLKISDVLADDLSECKVTSGAKEILEAINEGSELVIETIKGTWL